MICVIILISVVLRLQLEILLKAGSKAELSPPVTSFPERQVCLRLFARVFVVMLFCRRPLPLLDAACRIHLLLVCCRTCCTFCRRSSRRAISCPRSKCSENGRLSQTVIGWLQTLFWCLFDCGFSMPHVGVPMLLIIACSFSFRLFDSPALVRVSVLAYPILVLVQC